MSEYTITYDITVEAEDLDSAIDDIQTVFFTGEEHSEVEFTNWVRSVDGVEV